MTSANGEYLTNDVCMAMCATFDTGKLGDTTGDSRGCRLTYAQAASDPATYCQKAGPLGGGGCAEPCNSFCNLDDVLCAQAGVIVYEGGIAECEQACKGFTYLLTVDAGGTVGDVALSTMDTLNCRLYHLESAYDPTNPKSTNYHCPHTAPVSATCNNP